MKNKTYANPKIGDFPALSRIFNNTSPYCGSSVYKPPQTNSTISCPIHGIALIKLVITVAPHKDICPYGSTYPKNPVPIINISIITPNTQANVLGAL